jgi:hypothetical protein
MTSMNLVPYFLLKCLQFQEIALKKIVLSKKVRNKKKLNIDILNKYLKSQLNNLTTKSKMF